MAGFYQCFCGCIGSCDKVVYFDMDGTVSNLYAVEGWTLMLRSFDSYPYVHAEPMIDYQRLCAAVEALHAAGWKVGILSWLSKVTNPEYDQAVVEAKLEWLNRHFPPVDEIIITPHGVPKHESVVAEEAILIDDDDEIRTCWDASGPQRRSYHACDLENLIGQLPSTT